MTVGAVPRYTPPGAKERDRRSNSRFEANGHAMVSEREGRPQVELLKPVSPMSKKVQWSGAVCGVVCVFPLPWLRSNRVCLLSRLWSFEGYDEH